MDILKKCTVCKKIKNRMNDFYRSGNSYRGNCKACQIKRNVAYQRENQTWKTRVVDKEKQKIYEQRHRDRHPDSYKIYRETFLKNNPGYFRNYYLENKDKKIRKH